METGAVLVPGGGRNPRPILFVIALFLLGTCTAPSPVAGSSQELLLPTESALVRNPSLALDWANRVMANDPEIRSTAEADLVRGVERSLPLLRRFLESRNEDLDRKT